MRIARYRRDDRVLLGAIVGEEVVDLSDGDATIPTDVSLLLASGGMERAAAALSKSRRRQPLADAELLAPLPCPSKFLAIARNYAAHAAERGGRLAGDFPVFFNKQPSCIVGPGHAIWVPRVSEQVDYEGELGVVIANEARYVTGADARGFIAGYVIVNDVSVRDWQARSPTMTLGKSFDTHGPIGPWFVSADEIDDPHELRIRTWVNGELRQDASTADMIVNCYEQIETLSAACTLQPGDLIAAGTPSGVGAARTPPVWLRAGDEVRIAIDGIGELVNPVCDEPSDPIGARTSRSR